MLMSQVRCDKYRDVLKMDILQRIVSGKKMKVDTQYFITKVYDAINTSNKRNFQNYQY